MIDINVSKDFSTSLGGRFVKDGPHSGEEFRNTLLEPKYLEARETGKMLVVNLDGCCGYRTSFLDEAFGGLADELDDYHIMKNIRLITEDQCSLREYIEMCVNIRELERVINKKREGNKNGKEAIV